MKTPFGHLTYCTNIHAGENWIDHFKAIRENIPLVKDRVSPDLPFGIGLRLSHTASQDLAEKRAFSEFKEWLKESNCYVFTMNGFPYGGFHRTKVKDSVHQPDWITPNRVAYTIQLFALLSELTPENLEGGISTSPLSYKYWHSQKEYVPVFKMATNNIMQVVDTLIQIREKTGQLLHLDIEPEPDGLLESGPEFIEWYNQYLLPIGISYLVKGRGFSPLKAETAIRDHVQLCYDICHFAVGYEDHADVVQQLKANQIKVGKIQISAALKARLAPRTEDRKEVIDSFHHFNESTYLHQVVARQSNGDLKRYPDLPEALLDADNITTQEWRSHFHVPLFINDYGVLQSTQEDIEKVLDIQRKDPFTNHLEVETYTWEVLPEKLKQPLVDSIVREMNWVKEKIQA